MRHPYRHSHGDSNRDRASCGIAVTYRDADSWSESNAYTHADINPNASAIWERKDRVCHHAIWSS